MTISNPGRAGEGPAIVCFSGHMVDAPGRKVPRFPPALEGRVREAIERELEAAGATVGFAAAACGCDILFLESMLARGGEIRIVLPFGAYQFKRISVDFVPGNWGERFDAVLPRASRVLVATDGEVEGIGEDFERGNRLLMSSAITRSKEVQGRLVPMVVWDGRDAGGKGGTATFVSDWTLLGHPVRIVDLAALVAAS